MVNNTSNGEIFNKSVGFVPDTVLIDPDAWLITRNNTSAKLPACGTVSGLASSNVLTTTATVSWSARSGANNYTVDYKLASSGTWINAATATTSLSVNLSSLTAGSLYDWRVRANCTFEAGPYAQAQFTTSTSVCPGPYDVSSNGTASGAALIPFNTDIKGRISPRSDNDYYKFIIATGGTATITLTTLPANYDIRLYSSNGTTQLAISQRNGINNETISRAYTAGTYYVRVYGGNSSAHSATNCYTLKIALGTATKTSITKVSDDKIRINLSPNPANEILNISMGGYNNEKIIEVFDPTGKAVIIEKTMQNNVALRIGTLSRGWYLIKITARNGTVLSQDKFVKE